jgi:hypothetical protein
MRVDSEVSWEYAGTADMHRRGNRTEVLRTVSKMGFMVIGFYPKNGGNKV